MGPMCISPIYCNVNHYSPPCLSLGTNLFFSLCLRESTSRLVYLYLFKCIAIVVMIVSRDCMYALQRLCGSVRAYELNSLGYMALYIF